MKMMAIHKPMAFGKLQVLSLFSQENVTYWDKPRSEHACHSESSSQRNGNFNRILWIGCWGIQELLCPYCFLLFLVGGWATPLKNMNVNWDDDMPNMNGKIKLMFQTTNQKTSENHQSDFIIWIGFGKPSRVSAGSLWKLESQEALRHAGTAALPLIDSPVACFVSPAALRERWCRGKGTLTSAYQRRCESPSWACRSILLASFSFINGPSLWISSKQTIPRHHFHGGSSKHPQSWMPSSVAIRRRFTGRSWRLKKTFGNRGENQWFWASNVLLMLGQWKPMVNGG